MGPRAKSAAHCSPTLTMTSIEYHCRSLTELLEKRARETPDRVAIYTGEANDDPSKLLQPLTYGEVSKAVDRLAWHYAAIPGFMPEPAADGIPPPRIVAVLVSSAIDESFLEIALAKLGMTALLLSVNNSVQAVAHLTKLTKATHLIYGPRFVDEAHEAQRILREQDIDIGIIPDQRFPLWGEAGAAAAPSKPYQARLTPDQERTRPGVLLHSSGSVSHSHIDAYCALDTPADRLPQARLHHTLWPRSQHRAESE